MCEECDQLMIPLRCWEGVECSITNTVGTESIAHFGRNRPPINANILDCNKDIEVLFFALDR